MNARTRRCLATLAFIVLCALGVAIALMAAGCAAIEPYSVPPQVNEVTVRVNWSTQALIARRCPGKSACSTHGSTDLPYAAIWTEKPDGFDDDAKVCRLGHELLHALGARHQ